MEYEVLSQDERDEIVVDFMRAQERDHFAHSINKERYAGLLEDLPEGEFKERVRGLAAETDSRLAEVEAIITRTRPQLPAKAARDAALSRMMARESPRS